MQLCVQKCVQMNRRPWKEDTQNGNNRKSLNCKMVWSVGCKVVKSNLSFEHTWPSMFRWLSDTKCSGNLYLKSSFVQCGYPNKNFQIGLEIKILIFALCVRSRSIPNRWRNVVIRIGWEVRLSCQRRFEWNRMLFEDVFTKC